MTSDEAISLAIERATAESLEALAAALDRRREKIRLGLLEEVVGRFLHLRDQMEEIESTPSFEQGHPLAIRDLERLGKRELVTIETLRELMATA